MAEEELALKITLDDQGVVQRFEQLAGAQEKVKDAASGASSEVSGFGSAIAALGSPAAIAAAAIAGIGTAIYTTLKLAQRGDAYNDIADAFDKITEKAGVAGDALLNRLGKAVDESLPKLELMRLSNKALTAGIKPEIFDAVAQAAKRYADATGIDTTQAIEKFTRAISKGSESQLQQLGLLKDGKIYLEGLSNATDEQRESQRGVNDTIDVAKTRFQNLIDRLASTVDSSKVLKGIVNLLADSFFSVAERVVDLSVTLIQFADKTLKYIREQISLVRDGFAVLGEVMAQIGRVEFPSLSSAIDKVAHDKLKELQKEAEAVPPIILNIPKSATKAMKETADAIKKASDEVKDIQKELTSFDDFIGQMVGEDNLGDLRDQVREAFKIDAEGGGIPEFKAAILSVEEAFLRGAKGADEIGARLKSLQKVVGDVKDEFKADISGGQESGDDQSILFKLLGLPDFSKLSDKEITGKLLDGLDQAFSSIFGAIKDGKIGKDDLGALANGAGSLIGAGIGGAIGQTAGAALGVSIGSLAANAAITIGELAHQLFDNETAGTKARKEADKFFADIFDKNRLQVIIDGQIKEIRDLVFGGKSGIFGDGTFDDAFQSLSDAARGAFGGVGSAFEELLGVTDDISGQIAAVLVNNIGGSLNNLQLLVKRTGKSFDELQDAIVTSFENGQLSFIQAQTALQGIAQVAQKGIPDAIGATVQAVKNLEAAGIKGGLAAADALGDIGAEAKELSLKDFPALIKQLTASGEFSADTIKKIFDALQANGITTIDQLVAATSKQLIQVLSQLEASAFPFAEAANTATDLLSTIEKIPASKDVEINLRVNTYGDINALNNAVAAQGQTGGGKGVGFGATQ